MKKQQATTAMDALRQASKGLMMPSESDAPFDVVQLDGDPSPAKLRQVAGAAKDAAIEETSLDELFRTVPSEDKGKFQKLRQVIETQLSGVKVYTVGNEAERQILIVGKSPDGLWAGLKTSVVET